MSILEVKEVTAGYGNLKAIRDVSLSVNESEVVSIIGSNGAGKTTIMKAITQTIPLVSGEIWFDNERIDLLKPHIIALKGISLVPEGRRLFSTMNVIENLEYGVVTTKAKSKKNENMSLVFDLFPILRDRKKQMAGSLSGGQQEMLAIARALMSAPKLLLLDEPSLGLAPLTVNSVFNTLGEIVKLSNMTLFLSEQNVAKALSIADRGYVMEYGQIVFEGESQHLLRDPRVKKAYLGL
jgi:branched-chain amino acid transport system ATP-binding protein